MAICGLISTVITSEMVDQVNAKLPLERQFSSLGWYVSKTVRLFREYKRLFPNGKLHVRFFASVAVAFSCLICLMWVIAHL
jgi:hypothetical protein